LLHGEEKVRNTHLAWEHDEWYLGTDGVMYKNVGLTMPITVEEAISEEWDFSKRPKNGKQVKTFPAYRLRTDV
jgi:hypothetical protein